MCRDCGVINRVKTGSICKSGVTNLSALTFTIFNSGKCYWKCIIPLSGRSHTHESKNRLLPQPFQSLPICTPLLCFSVHYRQMWLYHTNNDFTRAQKIQKSTLHMYREIQDSNARQSKQICCLLSVFCLNVLYFRRQAYSKKHRIVISI